MANRISSDDDSSADLLLTLYEEEGEEEEEETTVEESPPPNKEEEAHHHYLRSIDSNVTTRQLPSRGLSFQLWPAATSLVSLLDLDPSPLQLPPHNNPPSPLRILELGSGTGLAGIAAAALLGAAVTLTDLPHVLPNLQSNADTNAGLVRARGGSIDVRQLSWGNQEDETALAAGDSDLPFDVVIASDVVYYDHLFDPLLQTLGRFVKGEVAFLMAHLRRWKKRDSVFFQKARKMFHVAVVHTDPPLPGNRIGVAIYRFTAKKKTTTT